MVYVLMLAAVVVILFGPQRGNFSAAGSCHCLTPHGLGSLAVFWGVVTAVAFFGGALNLTFLRGFPTAELVSR